MAGRFPEEVLQQIETCRETALAIEKYIGSRAARGRPLRRGPEHDGRGGHSGRSTMSSLGCRSTCRLKQTRHMLSATGSPNPFFSVHESVTNDRTTIGGRK